MPVDWTSSVVLVQGLHFLEPLYRGSEADPINGAPLNAQKRSADKAGLNPRATAYVSEDGGSWSQDSITRLLLCGKTPVKLDTALSLSKNETNLSKKAKEQFGSSDSLDSLLNQTMVSNDAPDARSRISDLNFCIKDKSQGSAIGSPKKLRTEALNPTSEMHEPLELQDTASSSIKFGSNSGML